ncbi:transglycosylase SLT domain-containing protein [Kitasatospora sp. A2-31]|uniref:aggregation-promoting factor C-terminal-like domain-containing protein n=1 Tax=Kitasatospora sp. A2-31 TaxID=2916414 RepID=UPI001EEDE00E|nr:transglycosylase SLT domain-containing protein [Kitasatospora sp. A2-31]MCG6499396.1 lytic transglycosylase domain-containing protein [Kitasatospora sp. A2-31]
MTRISVRGVAVASATAVTAVGAVVGMASGSEGKTTQTVDVAGATLLAEVPSGAQAQTISDNIGTQASAQQAAAEAAAKAAAEQKAAEEAARQKAAADAQAKADAEKAAKAAEEKRKADEAAANRSKARSAMAATDTSAPPVSVSPGSVQEIAQQIVGDDAQFQCFSQIVKRESGWDYTATNKSSGAYGLVQALPGSKMASAGADWRTNPATQIKWGLNYMNSRYGSPCGAWSFWQSHHWY